MPFPLSSPRLFFLRVSASRRFNRISILPRPPNPRQSQWVRQQPRLAPRADQKRERPAHLIHQILAAETLDLMNDPIKLLIEVGRVQLLLRNRLQRRLGKNRHSDDVESVCRQRPPADRASPSFGTLGHAYVRLIQPGGCPI